MNLADLLTHKSFCKLEQVRSRWELTHTMFDGSAVATICDKDFDRLIETYSTLVEAIEAHEAKKSSEHGHFFQRSWQDGTLVCECGAWK